MDTTILIGGVCRSCWAATTASADTPAPPAPSIERHIARVEAREATHG